MKNVNKLRIQQEEEEIDRAIIRKKDQDTDEEDQFNENKDECDDYTGDMNFEQSGDVDEIETSTLMMASGRSASYNSARSSEHAKTGKSLLDDNKMRGGR